jgi:glycosyltransferase involved in cell wall biosynthesis
MPPLAPPGRSSETEGVPGSAGQPETTVNAAGHSWSVSIVVPVLNGARTISACIDALLEQDYDKSLYEIIVVDNGSTDDTRLLVSRYPVTLLREESIRTSYAARNRGAAQARGEIVAFIDSDCVAARDWLRELVAPFRNDRCGAAAGTIGDATPGTLCEEFSARIQPFARPTRGNLRTLLTANVAIRREVLETLGGFDAQLPTGGDVDLGWRIQRGLGLELLDAPDAEVRHVHRSTLGAVFAQFRRYGLSEILLTTLYSGRGGSTKPAEQYWRLCRQLRACVSYTLAFAVQGVRWAFGRADRRKVLWPIFLLTVELGNISGKIEGLISTRLYRRNPYANPRLPKRDSVMRSG